jgi:two-component system response regulator DevR
MRDSVSVVVVDDHAIVRLGLRTLLGNMPWIKVVAEAGTADEAIQAAATHLPDAVVMDIRMPGASGIEACREIVARWRQTKVIMLTAFDDDALIFQALQAGASGYVLKRAGTQQLIEALDAVRQGVASLDPAITLRLVQQTRQHETDNQAAAFQGLSNREMMILVSLARGEPNSQIADALSLSEKTVRNHLTTIFAKMGFANRIEAATYAVRHNIEQHLPDR